MALTGYEQAQYSAHRAEGLPASQAFAIVLQKRRADALDWEWDEEFERDGFTVLIVQKEDDSPDLSWLGEFVSQEGAHTIPYTNAGHGEYEHYRPSFGGSGWEAHASWYVENDNKSRNEAQQITRQHAERDMQMHANWIAVGIIATVSLNGEEIGHDSCWGFDGNDDTGYLKLQGEEILGEAMVQACESSEAIIAKARLQTAAPALLEALRGITENAVTTNDLSGWEIDSDSLDKAEAAIKQAEGAE